MTSSVLPVFKRFPVSFVRGEGVYLYDDTGKKYLDFGSGVAVNALGHCHPKPVKALETQGNALWHCSNWYEIPAQEHLAKILTEASFADYAFFGNSGAEAIECGIKMVRAFFSHRNEPNRYTIITCNNSFHGRTFGAISAMGRSGFEPTLPGFVHVPYGDIEALKAAITPYTAAVLLEPIQGEGGVNPARLDYLQAVRALTQQHGMLLFLDEIQTGIGRTGKLFAYEWAGIKPDIVASAKGLGGGFPIGACLATAHGASGMLAGMHGSTFGGNPLACAVASAVLEEILQPEFLPQVDKVARVLWHKLVDFIPASNGVFTAVRGAGLLLGLQCRDNNIDVAKALLKKGLLVVPAWDNVIRLLPPLIITEQHVDEALAILSAYKDTANA